MKFSPAEPTDSYPFQRMTSESGVWELGIYPVIYGFRVGAGVVGSEAYSLTYCAAADRGWLLGIFAAVLSALEKFPESSPDWQIEKAFPVQQVKPMINDPACWAALQSLAYSDRLESYSRLI